MAPGPGEAWESAVRAEVGGLGWWDDPDSADLRARFKAFTGQRRDWPQPTLLFWKDLVLRVARRLRLCSAPAHLVTSAWFARPGGLTPLCLPQVLEEMRADGDILLKSELISPSSGSLYQLVRRVSQMAIGSKRPVSPDEVLVFKLLVEECAADIARQLAGSHWTSACVVTIGKFNSFFSDQEDAHVALCFLTQSGKARYLVARKQDPVEGVKLALTATQVPAVSKLDHDMLHLVWTQEKLQQQLDVLDHRWEISRRSALAAFKSRDKQAAYHYVYEAIQIGIKAMKENKVSIEEVSAHLKEVDELVAAQREVDAALESAPLQSLDGEGDIEEEFRKLEAELQDEIPRVQVQEPTPAELQDEIPRVQVQEPTPHSNEESLDEVIDSLSQNLSSVKLEAI
ncbi:hypothetical protein U9M48_020103 [Paspalum notatum var. saurae]|uniref:Charged multivesicular body protein 7 n=1 Tax=Paspalum notatum var. saurae TaxID=547442 RepID=A0AAQ3TDK5_PASNO